MTTIAQQLDNVLSLEPCPFCDSPAKFGQVPFEPQTDDSGGYYIACKSKVCDAGMGFRFACGEDPRPQMAAQWNKRAIRAAVGGEAVAWEWDYGALIDGLDFPIWIAWDNGRVDYVEEGATIDFDGCKGWMRANPPAWPKVTK